MERELILAFNIQLKTLGKSRT